MKLEFYSNIPANNQLECCYKRLLSGDYMRISFSTIFQVAALIVKDVLAFEAEQTADSKVSTFPSQTPATDNQTPVQ